MPIYEYHCSDCGSDFEKLVRFSDPRRDSPKCPDCCSENTRKRLSAIAAITNTGGALSAGFGCGSSGPFR